VQSEAVRRGAQLLTCKGSAHEKIFTGSGPEAGVHDQMGVANHITLTKGHKSVEGFPLPAHFPSNLILFLVPLAETSWASTFKAQSI